MDCAPFEPRQLVVGEAPVCSQCVPGRTVDEVVEQPMQFTRCSHGAILQEGCDSPAEGPPAAGGAGRNHRLSGLLDGASGWPDISGCLHGLGGGDRSARLGQNRDVIYRRTDADLPLLAAVAARVRAADGYPIHLPDDDFERFLRRPPPVDSWVALSDGVPLGHVALNDSTSRPVMELTEQLQITPAPIFVARLLVDPSVRRRGVGWTLLETARTAAEEMGRTPMLDVVDIPSAAPAIALYRRSGWVEVGDVRFDLAGDRLTERVFRAPGRGSTTRGSGR